MRALILIPLLALSACSGENAGWNPNYRAEATPYGGYLRAREAALTGATAEPPRVIPVALPARAPTAEQIAGRSAVQIVVGGGRPATATRPVSAAKRGAPSVDPTTTAVVAVAVPGTPASRASLTEYARTSTHAPGTRRYGRIIGNPVSDACSNYASPAAAQTAFLSRGGPALDPAGIDPDGDGYVCGWTPAAARQSSL